MAAPVRLRVGDEEVVGVAERVEEDGTLVVNTPFGLRHVAFGDLLDRCVHS